jgi:hypothetical protein
MKRIIFACILLMVSGCSNRQKPDDGITHYGAFAKAKWHMLPYDIHEEGDWCPYEHEARLRRREKLARLNAESLTNIMLTE